MTDTLENLQAEWRRMVARNGNNCNDWLTTLTPFIERVFAAFEASERERDTLKLEVDTWRDGGCVHAADDGYKLCSREEYEVLRAAHQDKVAVVAERDKVEAQAARLRDALLMASGALDALRVVGFDRELPGFDDVDERVRRVLEETKPAGTTW